MVKSQKAHVVIPGVVPDGTSVTAELSVDDGASWLTGTGGIDGLAFTLPGTGTQALLRVRLTATTTATPVVFGYGAKFSN